MTGFFKHRPDPRFAALRAVPMFADLPEAALRRVDRQLAELDLPAGTVLTRQDDLGREVFVIVEGLAAISVDGKPVCGASAGDLIGEISLLDSGPRTATVTALTPMRVYVLDPRQFGALFEEPQTSRWIATHLAKRLRRNTVAAVG